MKPNKELTKQAEQLADIVLSKNPKNEHKLLRVLRAVGFTGYSVKKNKELSGCADVEAEIFSTKGNVRGEIGVVNFVVPSCKTFYKRNAKGFIYNIEWYDQNFFRQLECLNMAYDPSITKKVIELAKNIDSISR